MQLTKKTLNKIELATKEAFPKEMCGVILQNGDFLKLQNISEKPETSFELDPLQYYAVEKDVAFIIHSHTQNTHLHPSTPSLADLKLAEATGKGLFICAIKHGQYFPPLQVPPEPNRLYLNRPYIFGVQDCGILIRDYYLFEFNIRIEIETMLQLYTKKYWEEATHSALSSNGLINLISFSQRRLEDMINTASLQKISITDMLKKGDILITSTLGMRKNHSMIWTGEQILNQSDFSKLEPLEWHLSKIEEVYRHPQVT